MSTIRAPRGVRVARIAEHLDDGDLLEGVHLGRRQAGAVVLAHRLDHVVDQPLDRGRSDRGGIDGLGDCRSTG